MSYIFDINIGMGLQLIDIDISGSDADLLANLKSAEFTIIYDDEEKVVGCDVAQAAGMSTTGPAGKETHLYQAEETRAGVTYTKTVFRVAHHFNTRGLHYLTVKLIDSDNDETTAAHAVTIGVGDGLPEGY